MIPVKFLMPCAAIAASITFILTTLAGPPARAAESTDVTVNGPLSITGGGEISNQSTIIGDSDEHRGEVTVDGDGSTWTIHGDLITGNSGVGILTIADGGRVNVDGAFTLANNFYYGSGTLNIGTPGETPEDGSAAGILNATSVYGIGDATIYFHHADDDYYFTTDGTAAGAAIDITGSIVVVQTGPGTTVLTGTNTYDRTDIRGGTLLIDGGSVNTSRDMTIGLWEGEDVTLRITNGATVESAQVQMARNIYATATAIVEGAGSTWVSRGELVVSNEGHSTLTIRDGGHVSNNGNGHIGLSAGLGRKSASGEATVDGAGSTWTNHRHLYVGNYGDGTLAITRGGAVHNMDAYIGWHDGSVTDIVATGAVTVDGEGSIWTSQVLVVGGGGLGTLTITGGGAVQDHTAFLGYESAGSGTATLAGAGSTWTNEGNMVVGNAGTGTLTITDGGRASNAITTVGVYGGSTGSLTIADGGTMSSIAAHIGVETGSVGDVVVTGTDASWTMTQAVMVGDAGVGTLTIADGGQVKTPAGAAIGLQAGSIGTVTIDGHGSGWTNNNILWVGGDGDGTLTLANGGTLHLDSEASTLTLAYNAGSTGVLNIAGATAGILNAATVASGASTAATVNFNHTDDGYYFTHDGTAGGNAITITGATAVNHTGTGTTVLTGSNDYTGPTTIDAGTLLVNGSIASATTVRAGGTLGGSGSVGDVIVTGGTIAPGNSPGTLNIGGSLMLDADSVLAFELDGLAAISDLIAIDGDLVLDGILDITNLGGLQNGQYTLITYTGSLTDNGLALGTLPGAGAFDFTIDTASTTGSVVLHVVPEPATLTLLVAGALGMLRRPRRVAVA